MSIKAFVSPTIAAVLVSALLLSAPARADKAKEVGPEDGMLCCQSLMPFLFQDNKVMVTTGRAGIFRSDNRGENWKRSMDGLVRDDGVSPFVGFICQAPSKLNVVYALAGIQFEFSTFNGLFASDDFGKGWTRRAEVDTDFGFNYCAVDADDSRIVYVSGFDSTFQERTWRSTDGGRTVQDIGGVLPACAVGGFVVPVHGSIYVRTDNCVAVSTDGGASFHLFSTPLPTPPNIIGPFGVSLDGRAIFIGMLDASQSLLGVFRSTDGGASYDTVSGLPFGFDPPLGFDPTSASRIYASDAFALKISTDGGVTFSDVPSQPPGLGSAPVGMMGVDRHGSVYSASQKGPAPFRTDDGGKTYRSLQKEFRASSVQDLAFDADGKLLVGVLHTQVVFRQSHGQSFDALGTALIDPNVPISAESIAGSPTHPNVNLVATSFFGFFRTEDGGGSWTSTAVEDNPGFFPDSRMRFPTIDRVYLVVPFPVSSGLYRSDDAGKTFAILSYLPFGAIAVDPTNPDTIYVGTYRDNTGLFKSIDGGQTLLPLSQTGDFSALVVDNKNSQVIYAGERLGQVLRSSDGGQTFTAASKGLAGAGVHGIAQDSKGTLYVWLRGGGLFSSKDGAKWKKVDTDEALLRSGVEAGRGTLVADPRHPGRVYLGNEGVIQIDD